MRRPHAIESVIVDHFLFDDLVGIMDEWEARQKNGGLNNGAGKRRIY
jgi:hypothetical protein